MVVDALATVRRRARLDLRMTVASHICALVREAQVDSGAKGKVDEVARHVVGGLEEGRNTYDGETGGAVNVRFSTSKRILGMDEMLMVEYT